jgi:hypothetical protein
MLIEFLHRNLTPRVRLEVKPGGGQVYNEFIELIEEMEAAEAVLPIGRVIRDRTNPFDAFDDDRFLEYGGKLNLKKKLLITMGKNDSSRHDYQQSASKI